MSLWTAQDIVKATNGQCFQSFEVNGISIDTRTLEEGDFFIALAGENGDGHGFVKTAFEKGAAGALVSQAVEGPHILVPDTLKGLEGMGLYARNRATQAKRIAVTGSVGKTGTKEMLKLVLGDQGKTTGSVASYNNHWGVPLTLARMPQDTEYGVFEIGTNHAGEIRPLAQMVAPHVALITTVVESHAGYFKSLQDILQEKMSIFEGVVPGGAVVINRDNPFYEEMKAFAKSQNIQHIYSFGAHATADCRLISADILPTQSHVTISLLGRTISYTLPIPGQHWVANSLAVLLAAHLVGADTEKAAQSLKKMTPPKGRGTRHEIALGASQFLLIDESYNASPASMRAAIAVLGMMPPQGQGRRIAVIGDMRELGEIADDRHAALFEPLQEAHVDLVYCCGPHMKKLAERLSPEMLALHHEVSAGLIEPLLNDLRDGDVVMVKGSLGTRMAPIVEALLGVGEL